MLGVLSDVSISEPIVVRFRLLNSVLSALFTILLTMLSFSWYIVMLLRIIISPVTVIMVDKSFVELNVRSLTIVFSPFRVKVVLYNV